MKVGDKVKSLIDNKWIRKFDTGIIIRIDDDDSALVKWENPNYKKSFSWWISSFEFVFINRYIKNHKVKPLKNVINLIGYKKRNHLFRRV